MSVQNLADRTNKTTTPTLKNIVRKNTLQGSKIANFLNEKSKAALNMVDKDTRASQVFKPSIVDHFICIRVAILNLTAYILKDLPFTV